MAVTLKIRKGDEVMVIGGKDRGKRGPRPEVDPKARHGRRRRRERREAPTARASLQEHEGRIIEAAHAAQVRKVNGSCATTGQAHAAIGRRTNEDTKERVCKRCGEAIVIEERPVPIATALKDRYESNVKGDLRKQFSTATS